MDEIRRARRVEELPIDCRLDAPIATERHHLVQKVTGMTGPEWPSQRLVVPALEIRNHHLVEPEAAVPAVELEDADEILE